MKFKNKLTDKGFTKNFATNRMRTESFKTLNRSKLFTITFFYPEILTNERRIADK